MPTPSFRFCQYQWREFKGALVAFDDALALFFMVKE